MATGLPPPPIQDPQGSFAWLEWYQQLRRYISTTGSVPWNIIDFAGSNITDISGRSHENLQALQGGGSGEHYHLTLAQYNALLLAAGVTSVAVNTVMSDSYHTYRVTATGKTMTLPACTSDRVGQTWTVILDIAGNVIVTPAGSDVIILPTTDTSITISEKGNSLSFRCLSTNTWGIV